MSSKTLREYGKKRITELLRDCGYMRSTKYSPSSIREKTLHELASGRIPRRKLIHKLGILFDLSDRWIGVHINSLVHDGLVDSKGNTSNQSYGLTFEGYKKYIKDLDIN